jgi:hypothetical protein
MMCVGRPLTPIESIQVPRVNNSTNRCYGHLSGQCAINTLQFQWRVTTCFNQRADEEFDREEGKQSIKN